jgi:tetratricopeptide (TPR) repeat protein
LKLKELLAELGQSPRDVRLLRKVGELLHNARKPAESAKYVLREAQVHADDGFFLKAIALAKQAMRMNPALTDGIAFLASMHERLGLKPEGIEWYRKLVEHRAALEDAAGVAAALEAIKRLGG